MHKKKYIIPLTALICLLSITGCSNKDKYKINSIPMETNIQVQPYSDLKSEWKNLNIEKYITRTAQQIWSTWPNVDKVWPGTNFSKTNIMFVETNGENAWLATNDKKITKFQPIDLPKAYEIGGVPNSIISSKNTMNGSPTLKVEVDSDMFKNDYDTKDIYESLPSSSPLMSTITVDEFNKHQQNWKLDKTNLEELLEMGKGNYKARTQRLEIINSLRDAILEPENEKAHLEAAKWWFEKYQKENEKEYKEVKVFDITRGTSRYFEIAMNIRSINGMNLSNDKAFMLYQDVISKDYPLASYRYLGLPNDESFDIGALSGILLEKRGDKSWKEEAEDGTPPLEVLLEDYKSTSQKESNKIKQLIKDIKSKRISNDK